MPVSYVQCDLHDGFVPNWLAAGPQAVPIEDPERFGPGDPRDAIARHYYQAESGIHKLPVERGPLTDGVLAVGDFEGVWSYTRCREDHLVDHSAHYPTWHWLRSWAYVQLVSEEAQEVALVLTTNGPADVWLNGQHVHRQERWSERGQSASLDVALQRGANGVLVRFEQAGVGECRQAMALRVRRPAPEAGQPDQPAAGVSARLPTMIRPMERRQTLERVLEAAYLERTIYARDDQVVVRWPDDLEVTAAVTVRLQTPSGRIYGEAHVQGEAGGHAWLGRAYQLPAGPYRVLLMPRPEEYYEGHVRLRRELEVWTVGDSAYSEVPYGTYPERRQEALVRVASFEGSLSAEIARMSLGRWEAVDAEVIVRSAEAVARREDGSSLSLVLLLGMLSRFGHCARFPGRLAAPLEAAILGYDYGHGEPGGIRESESLLLHTAELLAGQRYPERTFARSGLTGGQHRQRGERLVLDWLGHCAAYGLAEWGSDDGLADIVVALAHLIGLAEADQVYELAAVALDKVLLTIALSSYRGVLGSSRGRASSLAVQGGLLAPTAGITRLLWGQGIFNQHLAGPVSLACLEGHEVPALIADIAFADEELWSRERHLTGPAGSGHEVNKVTYRTPDYMLSSAQSYRPGEEGGCEQIWQATLGPAAVVFANHPACASDGAGRRPGFWLGNRVLPRVAQWQEVLIAIHNLPEDDWLGFTHAHFPTAAFDEYTLRDGWAFARRGSGYLALTASQGLELVTQGHSAWRELRSPGRRNIWLCQLGRAALDGEFGAFQEQVLGLEVAIDGLTVRCETVRGDQLSFGWEGPLLLNGQPQPLAGFKHYENRYVISELGAEDLEVSTTAYRLRLHFGGLS